MTATFWLQLSQPLANLWGVSAQSVTGIFALSLIIVITAIVCMKTGKIKYGLPIFLLTFFIFVMMGMIDWIVFIIVFIISVALWLRIGRSD